MRITIVTGADGAPFVHDLASQLDPGDELTAIVPIIRDQWVTGLKVSPDLDAFLDGGADATHAVADGLSAVGYSPAWHRPSDAAITSQLIRTELLNTGYSLTQATQAVATRRGLTFTLLPMSDDRAELHAVVSEDDSARAIHITEYLAAPQEHELQEVVLVAGPWSVAAEVAQHLASTDVVVLAPSSRTLAIDPVLRTPGLLDALDPATTVLVVEHEDDAPAELVQVSGLGQPDPGQARSAPNDAKAVLEAARS
jgi:LPPG:FO 2-phospho-L-lactate transferase